MSNMEQRLGPGMLYEGPSTEPGIVRTFPDGLMWLIKPDGTRCVIPCAGGGGGGAPADAEYVVMSLDPTLTDERVLTAGDALDLTDGGANGPATLDVLVDGVTVTINGFNQLVASAGSGSPTGPAGGVLDGTYPNPGLAASVAGDGLSELANVLNVNVDGTTIDITADVLGVDVPFVLTDAVIKNPGSSTRNLITSTGNFVELPIVGAAAQTAALFTVGEDGVANPFVKVVPAGGVGGAVGIGAGTYNPNSYGFTELTQLVISRSQRDDAGGGVPIVPAAGVSVVPFTSDVEIAPVVNNTRNHVNVKGIFNFSGTATDSGSLYGGYFEANQRGTKAAASGNQIVNMFGVTGSVGTRGGSTGDVGTIRGVFADAVMSGTGTVTEIIGVDGAVSLSTTGTLATMARGVYANISAGASGSTLPTVRGLEADVSTTGRVITSCSGVYVASIGGPGTVLSHGVRIASQVGSATTSFALLSEGGHSELRSGDTATIPLTIQGIAGQTARLQRWEDSALALLVGINAAGVVEFGSAADVNLYRGGANQLKTDDDLAVGANWLVAAAGFINGVEIATPATPAANNGRLYFRDSGGGVTQLIALWPSGNTTVIAEDF